MRIYLDMDGVLADFYNSPAINGERRGYGDYPEMYEDSFFYLLPPIPGALSSVDTLLQNPALDIWILSKPVKDHPASYADKVRWIRKYYPTLLDKIILTQDKSHLAGPARILVDDNLKWKSGWECNGGMFFHFDENINPRDNWNRLLNMFNLKIDEEIDNIRNKLAEIEA